MRLVNLFGETHRTTRVAAIALVALVLLTFGAAGAFAQAPGESQTGNYCVADFGGNSCTANDVRIRTLTPVSILDGCSYPGDSASVVFSARLESGATERYDIGLYIATDGGNALTGDSCYHDYLHPIEGLAATDPLGPTGSATPGDAAGTGPYQDLENTGTKTDQCGDISAGLPAVHLLDPITVICVDGQPDGVADPISTCVSWANNQQSTCTNVTGAVPGTGSKCYCETTSPNITFNRRILVDKQVPADPTSTQQFGFGLTGPGTNQAFSLTAADPLYNSGNLAAGTYTVTEATPSGWTLTTSYCYNQSAAGDPGPGAQGNFSPTNIDMTVARDVVCVFVNATPTAVDLVDFAASASGAQVTLRWSTASERDLAGFNVYRSAGAAWQKLNASLIPAAAPGSNGLNEYEYVDGGASTLGLQYRLEAVNSDGSVEELGVASAPRPVVRRWFPVLAR